VERKGGVLGKQIEPDVIDDGGSGQQAVSAAQSLIDAGVVAVIGHFNSSCTLPASRLYNDAKVLEISPGSTNPQYTEQGFPYAFRICGRDDQQGSVIANFLHDQLKLTKIAILDDKTTYGEGIAKIVKDAFEAKGGQVVMFQGVDANDFDFRANISVAQGAGAEALMWGGMYKGGGPLCVQMRQAASMCRSSATTAARTRSSSKPWARMRRTSTSPLARTTPARRRRRLSSRPTRQNLTRCRLVFDLRLRRGAGAPHRDPKSGIDRRGQGRGGAERPTLRHHPGPD